MLGCKNALYHLVRGNSRDFTKQDNVIVVSNTPSYSSYKYSIDKSNNLVKSQYFTIYINGWLVESRGAKMIMNTLKFLNDNNVLFVSLLLDPLNVKI